MYTDKTYINIISVYLYRFINIQEVDTDLPGNHPPLYEKHWSGGLGCIVNITAED